MRQTEERMRALWLLTPFCVPTFQLFGLIWPFMAFLRLQLAFLPYMDFYDIFAFHGLSWPFRPLCPFTFMAFLVSMAFYGLFGLFWPFLSFWVFLTFFWKQKRSIWYKAVCISKQMVSYAFFRLHGFSFLILFVTFSISESLTILASQKRHQINKWAYLAASAHSTLWSHNPHNKVRLRGSVFQLLSLTFSLFLTDMKQKCVKQRRECGL